MSDDKNIFIQVGATRDGLDPYLDCAKRRNMKSVLVETPSYLAVRKLLNRREFDDDIAVTPPSDADKALPLLEGYRKNIKLILAGFERYSLSVYHLAEMLKVPPYCVDHLFYPVDKDQQRAILSNKAPQVSQPQYWFVDNKTNIDYQQFDRYPLVVKPNNGAGGLGAYLVNNEAELKSAIELIKQLKNYDGSEFNKIVIEEYVAGVEMSLQGVCIDGTVHIVGCCQKLIGIEPVAQTNNLKSFRENGHVAMLLNDVPAYVIAFAKSCINAVEYQNGAFHIDFIERSNKLYFIEMGFRLSGGAIVDLVKRSSTIDWAELSFSAVNGDLNKTTNITPIQHGYVGLATLRTSAALSTAYTYLNNGAAIEIQKSTTNLHQLAQQNSLPAGLASDHLRHGFGIAKIWIRSESMEEVMQIMTICHESKESRVCL